MLPIAVLPRLIEKEETMKKRIRNKQAKQAALAMNYSATESHSNDTGVRVIGAIQLLNVSIVPKEQATVSLIGGKRMWYPLGSEKPVEVDW